MSSMDGLRFRCELLRASKTYTYGTHRSCPPDETFERTRQSFTSIGLTRVANITGLDRAGIPVFLAMRPNSRTLANSSGKGLTLAAARVSAVMEAIETYHAENVQVSSAPQSHAEISTQYPTIPAERLPPARFDVFNLALPQHWLVGWDLVQQREAAVPLSLVALGSAPKGGFDRLTLAGDSNGLASGNNLLEAVTSGLLELIERDALACHWAAWQRTGRPPPRIPDETIPFDSVHELLQRLSRVEIGAVIYDCTVDTGVSAYMALLFDERERRLGLVRGAGAHLDPEVAMLRAVTEAVQGRVVYMAGSRDDLPRRGLLAIRLHDDMKTMRLLESGDQIDGTCQCSQATTTFEGDVHLLIDKLRSVGVDQIIVLDLTQPGFDVSVVKVIVPGLEGYMWNHYVPGRRATTFVEART